MRESLRGPGYALLTVLLWSTLGVSLKLAVRRLDGFSVAVYVGLLAVLFLALPILRRRRYRELAGMFRQNAWFLIVTGIIGLGIQQLVYLKAFEYMPAGETVILQYLYPLWMPLFAIVLLKERVKLISLLFILMGFIGVFLLVSKGRLLFFEFNAGLVYILISSVSWALFSVLLKSRTLDIELSMFFYCIFGTLFLLLFVPVFGLRPCSDAKTVLGLVYIALVPTVLAFITWNKALHGTRIGLCSNLALITPCVSMGWIAVILGERFVFVQWTGFVLILLSVFLNLHFSKSRGEQKFREI